MRTDCLRARDHRGYADNLGGHRRAAVSSIIPVECCLRSLGSPLGVTPPDCFELNFSLVRFEAVWTTPSRRPSTRSPASCLRAAAQLTRAAIRYAASRSNSSPLPIPKVRPLTHQRPIHPVDVRACRIYGARLSMMMCQHERRAIDLPISMTR